MKRTAAYMDPKELNRSNLLFIFFPRFKNIVPKMRAITVVKKILVAVYDGFLQYDLCCFHRQAMHCVKKGCEN
jgi:hypothetical protein